MPEHIEDLFEDRARNGDGAFAIAYAIMQLANHQGRVADQLKALGLADAATPFGAIEALCVAVEKAGESIGEAITGAAEAMGE